MGLVVRSTGLFSCFVSLRSCQRQTLEGEKMQKYLLKRFLSSVVTVWFVMTLTFFLMNLLPGSPFSSDEFIVPEVRKVVEEKYGLNEPVSKRYVQYVENVLRGDFGVSYTKKGITTNQIISSGLPYSARIGLWAACIVLAAGVSFGILSAVYRDTWLDYGLMLGSVLGSTIPSFVFCTLFLYLFSKTLGWLPAYGVPDWKGYIGPAVVSSLFSVAFVTRLMKDSMLDVMQQSYIRTARSKGISEFRVIFVHVLRNAILPVVTYMGPMLASMLTGSFVIERVFGIPGIGYLFTTSVLNRDYTLIMGITIFFSVLLSLFSFLVDVIYMLLDPRIRLET